jgi:hypothetical protein
MNARGAEPKSSEHPDGEPPAFDFSALNRPHTWASPRPLHPDGTPAPGAFDPRSWWPRYQYRFTSAARRPVTEALEPAEPISGGAAGTSPVPFARPAPPEQRGSASRRPGTAPSAADLVDDLIVRQRPLLPTTGWRRVVFAASGGRVNPGLSEADETRQMLLRRIRRHLPGAHHIAVSSMKGGVGKTTVSAVLGLTLAEYRGDRVVAVDANPDAGTLADRLTGEIGVTVRHSF